MQTLKLLCYVSNRFDRSGGPSISTGQPVLWQAIQEWLPIQVKTLKRKHSLRLIINAILYVAEAGIQWRMMPNDLPAWSLVYYYFRKWSADGTVEKIHNQLVTQVRLEAGREASPSLGLID